MASSSPMASPETMQSLDGEWRITVDPNYTGESKGWFTADGFPLQSSRPTQVPGNVFEAFPDTIKVEWSDPKKRVYWYTRTFTPGIPQAKDLRFYLRFGAVRYLSEVWINGASLGTHEGGESPFEFEVTKLLLPNQLNRVTVRVASPYIEGISVHVPTYLFGGINHHVTLVVQPTVRIKEVFAKPDIKAGQIQLEVTLENNGSSAADVDLKVLYGEFKPRHELGTLQVKTRVTPGQAVTPITIPIRNPHLWNLDDPFLYTIKVTTDWKQAGSQQARNDEFSTRTGFRDFRVVDGYFHLNGKRIFLKSAHGNWFDPVVIQPSPRTMTFVRRDYPVMKRAGFNTLRFIISAAMPEQLDHADEFGFLIYSEHETSWLLKDPTKFGITLNEVVRRDRNHPSLVMWGLLNETKSPEIYNRAKTWLPSMRKIDDTRLVLLSSGRWDTDFRTGSASNPGSANWDVFWGGEDPQNPVPTGELPHLVILGTEVGGYRNGAGDMHIYQGYPTRWEFMRAFAKLGRNTKPFFLSEAGIGSSYNAYNEKRKMEQAQAPAGAFAWRWINPAIHGLEQAWAKYGLHSIYPSIEGMLVDSSLLSSRQRGLMFSLIRGNPKVVGYNLTGLTDAWGAAEGVLDNFREYKPGHLPVLQAGWAPLRWCLLVNPMNVYADEPLHLNVALANEDVLGEGQYRALLQINSEQGVAVWEKEVRIKVEGGAQSPLAYGVMDEEVRVGNLAEGRYKLSAKLEGRSNAAASELGFTVTSREKHQKVEGEVTVLGINPRTMELLKRQGAQLRAYKAGDEIEKEVIVVGEDVKWDAERWRELYGRIARGAQAIFLSKKVFEGKRGANQWIAVEHKGEPSKEPQWLYHDDYVALNHPVTAGLQTKIMDPDYYGALFYGSQYFKGIAVPDETIAVAIHCTYSGSNFAVNEGVLLGTYKLRAGTFTISAFDIAANIGVPATDRLLINLVANAQSGAKVLHPASPNLPAELNSLGIVD